ncbi:hypothetical protein B0J12DRAFT_584353, partial [Macrophomina phaseolina]
SGQCECGQGMETVRHVLLVCPQWQQARSDLASIVGERWGDVSYMLGGWSRRQDWRTGQPVDGPKERWRPDVRVVKAVVQFLKSTSRLSGRSNTGGGALQQPPREH